MKIRADEHVAPKILRAITELVPNEEHELSHVRDDNAARTADETWVPRFAAEGGTAILSADRHMLARPHQQAAILASGLICILLPAKWSQSRRHEQAALLLWWWPRITATIARSERCQCWRVPFDFGSSDLEPISVRPANSATKRP